MFNKSKVPLRCRKFEARFEDYLDGASDAELDDHLSRCADCRATFEDSRLGAQLLRDSLEPAMEPDSAFLAGVVARIREEQRRAESPAAFWSPLEFLASRLSLVSAMLLLALSVYLVEFAPRRMNTPPRSPETELNAEDFPQPPGDPVSVEEVLQSLAERSYGH